MRYSEDLIDEVRKRNDIVQVVSQYVKIKKRGSNYFGCCPFHNERTPSFSVSPSKQIYYCFGCGAGGDVFSFVMQYENKTFQEAVQDLASRAGVALPEGEVSEEEKRRSSLKQQLLEVNKEAAKYYYYLLRSEAGTRAREYFTGRHLTGETMQRFGLGYSQGTRDDLYRYLRSKHYSDELLSQSGLVKFSERGAHDLFWNRAMFPIMNTQSRVIGFGGRVMGSGEPKYLNSPETPIFEKSRNLYGLHIARRSRREYFLVCEGYMDVIAMHQAGFDCAVASLGTALTEEHTMLIGRYVKNVILTYDSDGAGIKAAMRAIPMLRRAGVGAKVLNLKPWKDPDEFIVHEGAEAFEERIRSAQNAFLFQVHVVQGRYDLNDPQGKTEFEQETARMLLDFPDELERGNYLDAVCTEFSIPKDSMEQTVRRMSMEMPEPGYERETVTLTGTDSARRRENSAARKDRGEVEAERLVLNWACSEGGRPDQLMKYLSPEDFSDAICREIAGAFWADWKAGKEAEPARALTAFAEDEEQRNQAAAVFQTELPEDIDEREEDHILSESVRRIRSQSLIRAASAEKDVAKLQQIIQEKARIEHAEIVLIPER